MRPLPDRATLLRHRLLSRLALALSGLILSLLLLEGGLRVLAAVRPPRSPSGPAGAAGEGGIVVLCEGDSSVYGLYVGAHEAYPARLESLLNEGFPGGRHRVVNLGVPGSHSLQVLERLPSELDRHAPAAVVWLCGINDLWALPGEWIDLEPAWFEGFRVVRLVRLLAFRLRDPVPPAGRGAPEGPPVRQTEDGKPVWRTRAGEEVILDLRFRENWLPADEARGFSERALARFRTLAEASGARPLVVLYPTEMGPFATANAAIRAGADRAGIRIVETRGPFDRAAAAGGPEAVFFADHHPKPLGYEILARLVHDALAKEGVVSRAPIGDPLRGLQIPSPLPRPDLGGDRSRPDIRLVGTLVEPDGPAIEIRDRPGLAYWLGLSFATSPSSSLGGFEIALADDALRAFSMGRSEFRGVFDEEGLARIRLKGLLGTARAEPGTRFFAAYAIVLSPEDPWVRAVSGSVELVLR